ncbi:MAG: hypothetical protein M3R41_06220, partial [Pseudomonadota bacterium]|nr:hypothetical protein [Pseudomonadota bacterium]
MGPAARARGPHGVAIGLFLLVWLSCAWFGSWELNPNNATRLFGAIALVEQGDAKIDRFETLTIDKAQFGQHHYMDKAPGMTLLAAPVVAAANAIGHTSSRDQVIDITSPSLHRFIKARLMLAVTLSSALLTAFATVLLLDLGTGITGSASAGLFAALGYALGSIIWGWSTTLLGHAPVGALLMVATWAVWRGTDGAREAGRWRYPILAGVALGGALVIEFTAVFGGLCIGLWVLWRTRHADTRAKARLYGTTVAVAVAMLVPLALYNQIAFGTPFKLGYEGVVGFKGMDQGLFGLTYPKPIVLYAITLGMRRGLIWVAPVLMLGVIGLRQLIRDEATRDLGLLAVAIVSAVLLVNASYVYWDGGASIGPRHSVPAIPFLALGLAPFWASLQARRERIVSAALLGVSMAINLAIAATDIFGSEFFTSPLRQRTWPLFRDG